MGIASEHKSLRTFGLGLPALVAALLLAGGPAQAQNLDQGKSGGEAVSRTAVRPVIAARAALPEAAFA